MKKLNIADFWWFNNSTCWRIQREGFVDAYLFLPTMKYIYKSSCDNWYGTKDLNSEAILTRKQEKKVKQFADEDQAVRWLCKLRKSKS